MFYIKRFHWTAPRDLPVKVRQPLRAFIITSHHPEQEIHLCRPLEKQVCSVLKPPPEVLLIEWVCHKICVSVAQRFLPVALLLVVHVVVVLRNVREDHLAIIMDQIMRNRV